MWNENDRMMELVEGMGLAQIAVPAKCPICNEVHAHFLMHRFDDSTNRGTAWIWCDSCGNYTHFSYFLPTWWENPDFIDTEKLDSLIEYPHSIEGEIDEWICALLRRTRTNGTD